MTGDPFLPRLYSTARDRLFEDPQMWDDPYLPGNERVRGPQLQAPVRRRSDQGARCALGSEEGCG
jgi:hypothetical protein